MLYGFRGWPLRLENVLLISCGENGYGNGARRVNGYEKLREHLSCLPEARGDLSAALLPCHLMPVLLIALPYALHLRALGSIPSSQSGSMPSAPLLSLLGCSRPMSLLSVSVPTFTVPLNRIFLFPKRYPDYALGMHLLGDDQRESYMML